MQNRSRLLAFGAIALALFMALPAAVRTTEAAPPKPPPPGFPPVAGCGKIESITYQDFKGNTVVCKVWRFNGTKYCFNGIEDYNVNDLVFVQGQACTICLPFCGGAIPIANSFDAPCQ